MRALLLLLTFALSGCTTFQKDQSDASQPKKTLMQRMPWAKDDPNAMPEPYPNPVKLATVWSPETLTQAGRVPTRGFGARVFFYDEKTRAVPVDGTLIVHGFNESGGSDKPDVKRYEFTPEQFTKHFSRSDLGASYSVWIPWDAVGGDQQRISLVASFKTAEGKTLQGSPTTVLLPGAKQDRDLALAQRFSPEYRAWQSASSGKSSPTTGLTTTTIQRPAATMPAIPTAPVAPVSPSTWNVADSSSNLNSVDVVMRRNNEIPVRGKEGTNAIPASARTGIR
ncbi:hypothetical protein [Neorhodopirellula pilleata]|nr:hypothetical protein [Neorhodopirellula pilleata]